MRLDDDFVSRAAKFCILDEEQIKLTNSLKTARGKHFKKVLIETFHSISPKLKAEARAIKAVSGIKVRDVAELAIRYNLQLKHCFDFLEDSEGEQIIRFGTYDRLRDAGLKSNQIMWEALQELEDKNE
jgi:hypothetical protein